MEEKNNNEKNAIVIDGVEYGEAAVRRLLERDARLTSLEGDIDYDYEKAVREDVRGWIDDHMGEDEIRERIEDPDDFKQELSERLFCEDRVTGNASGSYTFNAHEAALHLVRNIHLYEDACEELGGGPSGGFSPEGADVTIRCHLLYSAVDDVVDALCEEYGDGE